VKLGFMYRVRNIFETLHAMLRKLSMRVRVRRLGLKGFMPCSQSSPWLRVHWFGLRLFGATKWKLLIIESFSQRKLNKIETGETVLEFWGCSWCCWKAPWQWVRFNRVYFTIFRAKVWKLLIFEWILLLKIQTNCKNWVWNKKNSWIFNVFTLGPTA
jgi:hypothetical protein